MGVVLIELAEVAEGFPAYLSERGLILGLIPEPNGAGRLLLTPEVRYDFCRSREESGGKQRVSEGAEVKLEGIRLLCMAGRIVTGPRVGTQRGSGI